MVLDNLISVHIIHWRWITQSSLTGLLRGIYIIHKCFVKSLLMGNRITHANLPVTVKGHLSYVYKSSLPMLASWP